MTSKTKPRPPLVEVVFGAGRLGIKIHSDDGLAPVRVKAFIPERETGEAPPVERCGLVAVGDMILSVGSVSVIGKDYSTVLRAIRTHPRPLTIRFGDAVSAATSGESARVDLTQRSDPVATFSPLSAYRRCLESGIIDLAELRHLSFQGCPEERRSTVWQLLLNYLPADPSQWPEVRTKMRTLYVGYKRDFLVGPPPLLGGMELLQLTTPPLPEASAHHQEEGAQLMADLVAKSEAHALRMLSGGADDGSDAEAASAGARSRTLAGDSAEADAVEVATRTRRASGIAVDFMRAPAWFRESPRLRFFPSVVPGQQEERDGSPDATIESAGAQLMWRNFYVESSAMAEIEKDVLRTHPGLHFFNRSTQQRLADMLYVYAKLNPGISYVQGMNELLAPLYYVIAQALGEGHEDEAEADTFYCFTNLMSEVRSLYVKDMDKEDKGIYGSMRSLTALINEIDLEIGEHLAAIGVSPEFYAFRWLTTLGSREFDLPDVLQLWDTLFADPQRFGSAKGFLFFFAVSMITLQRESMLKGDFAFCLKLLQRYPPTPLDVILERARELVWQYRDAPPPTDLAVAAAAVASAARKGAAIAGQRVSNLISRIRSSGSASPRSASPTPAPSR